MAESAFDIQADAKARWIAPDGLMKLNPEDNRAPEPGQVFSSAGDDNGILFRVYNAYLAHTRGVFTKSDALDLKTTIDLLRRPGAPGNFLRNPGRVNDGERMDDYCAIAAGDMLIKSYLGESGSSFAEEICNRGDQTGYVFVVENPEGFDIQAWRQGSDIAHYQLIASRFPQFINLFWICAGFVFQAFQGNYVKGERKYTSENLMSWLRYRSLLLRIKKAPSGAVRPFVIAAMIAVVFGFFWRVMMLIHTAGRGIEWLMEIYFLNPEHPNRRLAQGVKI